MQWTTNHAISCSCSLDIKSGNYEPHDKEWVKEQIYSMLRKQAGKNWFSVIAD